MIQRSQKKILRKNIKKCFQKKFPFTKISKFHFLCHSTLVKQKFILLLYFPINFHRIHSRTFINSHPTHPHVSVCVRERMKIPQKNCNQVRERKGERETVGGVRLCEYFLSQFSIFSEMCAERIRREINVGRKSIMKAAAAHKLTRLCVSLTQSPTSGFSLKFFVIFIAFKL